MGYFRMSFIFELFEEEVFYENLTLKKPTINSNHIVRSRATTRECGCHGIASLFQDFQQTSRIAMALYSIQCHQR